MDLPTALKTKKEYSAKNLMKIMNHMLCILNKCIGATKETLCAETARAYNYNRMTRNIFSAMDNAFELLVKGHHIDIIEGKVVQVE